MTPVIAPVDLDDLLSRQPANSAAGRSTFSGL